MTKEASKTAKHIGREYIARLAEGEGECLFAREVRGGCWDHRRDVANAITTAQANIDGE